MKKKNYLEVLLLAFTLFNLMGCNESDLPDSNTDPIITTMTTFNKSHLSFGGEGVQSVTGSFEFLDNTEKVEKIMMYVKLDCPSGGCGAWDVFANIKVEDPSSGIWYELGRFITPYGVDNSQRVKGFEFDVTDFRSLLKGSVKLKSFVEVWTPEGWLLTVDFKITEDDPEYTYSAIVPLIDYTNNSQQIPYGVALPDEIKLTGDLTIPSNTESAKLRTIISGWGHATPYDSGGRGCAEWCFRTHVFSIGNSNYFHEMKPLGCATNMVNPQGGNWEPDRAGWCPGMEVPVRVDKADATIAGETLNFEYQFEEWVNNEGNGQAYYSLSTYLVLESNSPIENPVVN